MSAHDITERHRAEQDLRERTRELAEQAVHDPLTGLANRTLFEERLRAVLSRDARTGDATGVLFLDLDGFKSVNDEHGHQVGDAVLRVVAARLIAAVRPADTVARLGGDEFVVLVEGCDQARDRRPRRPSARGDHDADHRRRPRPQRWGECRRGDQPGRVDGAGRRCWPGQIGACTPRNARSDRPRLTNLTSTRRAGRLTGGRLARNVRPHSTG